MQTKMMAQRLDNVESKIAAIKIILLSHDSTMKDHSTQLSSLLANVSELFLAFEGDQIKCIYKQKKET